VLQYFFVICGALYSLTSGFWEPLGEVDEVYQDDELSCSFNINPDLALNSLVDDANEVTLSDQTK
jgi:hypothetical protein